MKNGVLLLVLMFTAITMQGQDIIGDWYGLLNVQGMQLKLVFHISNKTDSLTATWDSPDQFAFGKPVDEIKFVNNKLSLNVKSIGMTYKGVVNNAIDTINGTFEQGTAKLILVLSKKQQEKKLVIRPQDPKDFPYYKEDVIFKNNKANVELAGTLTLPRDKKVSKIVILITGSGPQNRDEEVKIFNHRPFLVWSDWLTKQGIGVLRYDDRGVGKSTGHFNDATSEDFSDDAEAGVNYLLSRNDLKNVTIGLMGHSEGGMIAPMVAARNKKVAFIVLLAGPGISIDQLMTQQMHDVLTLKKVPENIINLSIETNKKIFAYLKENRKVDNDELSNDLKEILKTEYEKYPKEALVNAEPIDTAVKKLTGKWLRYFITYDPAKNLELVTCPVLAINGTLDCQVNCKSNLTAIKLALGKSKNKNFEIVPMEGLNHILQKASTGAVEEYSQIEETINPKALIKVSNWINNLK